MRRKNSSNDQTGRKKQHFFKVLSSEFANLNLRQTIVGIFIGFLLLPLLQIPSQFSFIISAIYYIRNYQARKELYNSSLKAIVAAIILILAEPLSITVLPIRWLIKHFRSK